MIGNNLNIKFEEDELMDALDVHQKLAIQDKEIRAKIKTINDYDTKKNKRVQKQEEKAANLVAQDYAIKEVENVLDMQSKYLEMIKPFILPKLVNGILTETDHAKKIKRTLGQDVYDHISNFKKDDILHLITNLKILSEKQKPKMRKTPDNDVEVISVKSKESGI